MGFKVKLKVKFKGTSKRQTRHVLMPNNLSFNVKINLKVKSQHPRTWASRSR